MHDRRIKNIEFWHTFKYSLMITLGILILVFYLFPRFSDRRVLKTQPIQIRIYINDIPQTRQPQRMKRLPPRRPVTFIPVTGEEPDFPDEIVLEELTGTAYSSGSEISLPPETPAKSLLEVYPSTSGVTCKGYIRVLLLINKTGMVETAEVLENTTLADTCISLVREAALKSRWIPAKVKDEAVSSWVVKEYKFDLKK
jgi:hypothetical protein